MEDKDIVATERNLPIDPKILETAKTKNSPVERIDYFNMIYDQVIDQMYPPKITSKETAEQDQNTLLRASDLQGLYKTLFARDLIVDAPDVEQQLKLAQEKNNGDEIPLYQMTAILESAAKTASMEKDKPSLPKI